jgi:hypothetical protein
LLRRKGQEEPQLARSLQEAHPCRSCTSGLQTISVLPRRDALRPTRHHWMVSPRPGQIGRLFGNMPNLHGEPSSVRAAPKITMLTVTAMLLVFLTTHLRLWTLMLRIRPTRPRLLSLPWSKLNTLEKLSKTENQARPSRIIIASNLERGGGQVGVKGRLLDTRLFRQLRLIQVLHRQLCGAQTPGSRE